MWMFQRDIRTLDYWFFLLVFLLDGLLVLSFRPVSMINDKLVLTFSRVLSPNGLFNTLIPLHFVSDPSPLDR